jgi:hypothetical protein
VLGQLLVAVDTPIRHFLIPPGKKLGLRANHKCAAFRQDQRGRPRSVRRQAQLSAHPGPAAIPLYPTDRLQGRVGRRGTAVAHLQLGRDKKVVDVAAVQHQGPSRRFVENGGHDAAVDHARIAAERLRHAHLGPHLPAFWILIENHLEPKGIAQSADETAIRVRLPRRLLPASGSNGRLASRRVCTFNHELRPSYECLRERSAAAAPQRYAWMFYAESQYRCCIVLDSPPRCKWATALSLSPTCGMIRS